MFEKKVKTTLLPLLNKMHIKRILASLSVSFLIWSVIFFVLAIIYMFTPVLFINRIIMYSFIGCLSMGLITGLFLRPKLVSALPIADSFGFKERLTTSWELRKESTEAALLQRKDTIEKLGTIDFSKNYKIKINKKLIAVSLFVFLFSITLYYIPAQSKDDAKRNEQVKKVVAEEIEKLEQEKQKALDKYNLDQKQKELMNKKLNELLKEIEQSQTRDEAIKNLKIAKNEMEKLNTLQKLGKKMENTSLKELAKQLKKSDLDNIKKELEKLSNEINKNSKQKNIELSKELQKLAQQVMDNEELRNNLLDLAKQLASSNPQALAEAMQNLSNQLMQQAATGMTSDMSSFASEMANAFMSSSNDLAGSLASNSSLMLGTARMQGTEGVQSGDGAGMQGSGNGAGGNNGSDGEGAGNGAGKGSTNEDEGYNSDYGKVNHNDSSANGEDKFGEYEELYLPDRLGGDTPPDFVPGQGNDTGQSSYRNVEGMPVEAGQIVPYKDVIGSYSESAIRTMNQIDIPSGMKDIIAEYFSSLD